MTTYTVFRRSATSFKSLARARRFVIRRGLTGDEALRVCDAFNNNRNAGQIRRGTKYEFTAER